ncbi:MAG: UDP-N-acetylglucosamine 2-epimerase [Methanomicrobiales archaeon]|nr:UDP-N-acetylglucosamine 2-epimerase [Methanomicrobiales archaeon]
MRKILYLSGSRADYGLMLPVLDRIRADPALGLEIMATGMHLMEEFGSTVGDIERDGFRVHRLEATCREDDKRSMVEFTGDLLRLLSTEIPRLHPDILLLLGDRAEMLAGAIAGSYLSIPVAHVHGGDVSSTVDEHARHAITKLAHIHFPATRMAEERIIRMGEDPSRVFVTGAPSLDPILAGGFTDPVAVRRSLGLGERRPVILVIQHPVTLESDRAGEQMEATLRAVADLGHETIVIYPNADAGGRQMIRTIGEYSRYPFIHVLKNLPRRDFLGLLSGVDLLVGNSSAGIIEAPSFHLPVVNIGSRQEGRDRSGNIIDVPPERTAIRGAMEKALSDPEFRERVRTCTSPYGDGHASERIVAILREIPLGKDLLQKKLVL